MTHKGWTLGVVCAATFMLLLDVTIVVVALPDIEASLHTNLTEVQWVTDAYALTLAALLLTAGALADRYGRRRLFLAGLVIFTAGSVLCAAAQSPLMLILSRAAQGIGGALLFSTALALLAATFHGRERGTAFGVWGAVSGVATALGPILGGLITTGVGWRGVFWVNLPVGLAAIWVALAKVGESRAPHPHRPDVPGFVAFTGALVALVYGLIRASSEGWTDAVVTGCFVAAAVLLVAFVLIEARTEHPMFDLALLRIPTFAGGSIAAFAMNGSIYALLVYLTLYLQQDLGFSALQTGLRLLLMSGATMVVATIAGRLADRLPVRLLIGVGLLLVGVGLFTMSGLDAGSSWTHLALGLVLTGIGGGLVNPALASTAVGVVHHDRSGMASGANTTFRQVGIAVGIAVYGTVFSSAFDRVRSAEQASAAWATGVNQLALLSGGVAVVGGLLALVLIRQRDFVATGPGSDSRRGLTSIPELSGGDDPLPQRPRA